ncbi:sulfate/molybdate ABC transporter ATP-binding protein [Sinomonas terrae]|uniref:ATP-binding cassette domain-containing protein n=1 Tax=Sinomonas terrae TaxID=2908838 RepID=A0ABS9U686_9MICC|nr:ATP-binding cassette domain-containing protein [Sinomonas terrae]MCH6472022.1 ATP-binding cassette domain-containing protein [Sinomonas terrae]
MSFRLEAAIGERGFDAALEVQDGETVAVLGPNGAGKSTLFALAAGLLRADSGRAVLDGRVLFDDGAWVPPHARGVALLAQEPLLFPHLNVVDNVAFGPRASGASRRAARAAAERWLGEVDAVELAERRPAQLSGGQAQRVAIARALAAEPQLLLLDEPFAALDVAVAPALRRLLRRVLAERTAVLITHEALDAHMLADRVVVLEAGRVVEEGPTAELLERPRSRFAAGLAGLNFLEGRTMAPGRLRVEGLGEVFGVEPSETEAAEEGEVGLAGEVALAGERAGEEAVAVFRPADVSVYRPSEVPHGSPRNAWRAVIEELEPRGPQVRVHAAALRTTIVADLTPAAAAELDLGPGSAVVLVAKAAAVTVYSA